MNIQVVLVRDMVPVSLRMACDINRAWSPMLRSPMSPSISLLGVSAATESMTIISIAEERMSCSVISRACSPLSGCEMSRLSTSTPSFSA